MPADTGSGSASSAATGATGYTIAELLTKISTLIGWSSPDSAQNTRMYQAITSCALAASTWKGSEWSWLRDTGTVTTADGTASYALRTTISDLWAVERAYYDDDWPLAPVSWRDYQEWYTLVRPTAGTNQPSGYVVRGEPPYIHLQPVPASAYTINIDYIKRHGTVNGSAADSVLIVPREFQEGIYVDAAVWMLRSELTESFSLTECPPFMETIGRMVASSPMKYDQDPEDMYPDTRTGFLPPNRRFMGGLIENAEGY